MFWDEIIAWLERHLLKCPSKQLFHLDCPGCGLQRSVIAMLKGDFSQSLEIYPPGILIVVTLSFLLLHLRFRFKNGPGILKILYIASVITIVTNYIFKIVTKQLI